MDQQSEYRDNGWALARDLTPELVPVAALASLGQETRKHPPRQVRKLAKSLAEFGFVLPVMIDAKGRVVAGWGLVLAARQLGLSKIPAVRLTDLSDANLRLLRLTLNRLGEDSAWDHQALAFEFSEILQLEPQSILGLSGFEAGEIDVLLDDGGRGDEDDLPEIKSKAAAITGLDDLWVLGEHRLYCGNALEARSYDRLLGDDKAQMVFSDPPYNVPIDGHASGLGAVKHPDFVMGWSGELSSAQHQANLRTSFEHTANRSVDGAIHFVCTDWRHQGEMLAAGKEAYGELKNLCVWVKSSPGMGSLYRSQHELVNVWKVGAAPHTNNVALGKFGRNRKLSLHPTVKPVAMIADAMCDCSHRNDLILDPFGGAGTTLIAAERTGRRARVMELDPVFVDVSVERWQRFTGRTAVRADTGEPFSRPGCGPATPIGG